MKERVYDVRMGIVLWDFLKYYLHDLIGYLNILPCHKISLFGKGSSGRFFGYGLESHSFHMLVTCLWLAVHVKGYVVHVMLISWGHGSKWPISSYNSTKVILPEHSLQCT